MTRDYKNTPKPGAPKARAKPRAKPRAKVTKKKSAPKATPGKRIKITGIQPINQDRVKITATDEEADYYLSEFNGYDHVINPDFEDDVPTISNLILNEDLVIVGNDSFSQVTASWDIAGEYGGAFIETGFEGDSIK